MPPADAFQQMEGYANIAETFDIDHDAFIKFMKQDVNEQSARADFLIAFDLKNSVWVSGRGPQTRQRVHYPERRYVDYETLSSRDWKPFEAGKRNHRRTSGTMSSRGRITD